MGTDNPKVSAYVPQVLKDRLKGFREERDGISESQAVTIILAEYFQMPEALGRSPEGSLVGGVTLARMEALEEKLVTLLVPPSSLPSELLEKIDQLSVLVESLEKRIETVEHGGLLSRLKDELREADLVVAAKELEEVISQGELSLGVDSLPIELLSELPKQDNEEDKLEAFQEVDNSSLSSEPLNQDSQETEEQVIVENRTVDSNESKPEFSLSSEPPNSLMSKPLPGKIIAKRLKYHPDSLSKVKTRATDEEFLALSFDRDPDDIAWKFVKKGRGYLPANELSNELRDKLLTWLKENFPEHSL
jgi:hypothetical protein